MISLIVAYAKNHVIGNKRCIPWKIEGDIYFPEFDEDDFIKEVIGKVDGDIPYTYLTYTRKR